MFISKLSQINPMDFATLSLIILCFVIGTCFLVLRSTRQLAKLPPGPRPLPVIGNIHQLGPNPHQSLANLSKIHGPLMSLQLGSLFTVVVSSPEIAQQVLQKHDQLFSSRSVPAAAQVHSHSEMSVLFLPVGNRWRKLRKICREQMFSPPRLDASQALRRAKLHQLRDHVQDCCNRNRAVNVGLAASTTALNLMSATLFSVDFAGFDSDRVSQELKETIEGVGTILGLPNLADFFPLLECIDPQRIKRRSKAYFGKLLGMFEDIINQRLESRSTSIGYHKKSDLLEVLLDLSSSQGIEFEMGLDEIKHLFLDLFLAGSDSTSITVEWVMMELLINPDKMAKAKKELANIIGENKQVQESDISKLPYLRALVKETLRHHPAAPLLPHKSVEDVKINGYTIPRGAQVFVNVWAIGRDSSIWPNPSSFEPERFLDSEVDFNGQHFTFFPFGSGRRMCPGLPLADRLLHLMVACLIHNFDWKLEPGVKQEDVDTSEKFGLSLHKAVPLMAIPMMKM